MFFYILMPFMLLLGLLVAASVIAALAAVGYYLLPGRERSPVGTVVRVAAPLILLFVLGWFFVPFMSEDPVLFVIMAAVAATGWAAMNIAMPPVQRVPVSYNLRNLQVRWKTTLVTALAFTLVTALVTIMLAFVRGMDRITQTSAIPGNVIVLADGATDETFSNVASTRVENFPDDVQRVIQKTTILREGKEERAYLFSQEVYVLVSHVVAGQEEGGRKRRFIQMRGLENALLSARVHDISLAAGDWWNPDSARRPDPSGSANSDLLEVVLGDGIAKTLGADAGKGMLAPGDIVQIGPQMCYVVGVMNPKGSYGSEVWSLDTQIQQTFNRGNRYSSFVLRTADDEVGAEVAAQLKKHSEKYNAYTESAYYKRLEDNNNVFRVAIWFLGVVMAVGGVLGVTNTMFAAISQRAKDIGVLRLIGYTRFQILCSFLIESVMIALIGGLLGCFLGWLTDGLTATSIVSSNQGGGKSVVLQLVVDASVLLPGLLLALVMGAVGGLIPSINAMRLRPLESLR